jgi:hypothetical protein
MVETETEQLPQPRPTPPVKQLEDVPPEEWTYWSAQAWAGCGVIGALILAMFLPLTLSIFMDGRLAKLVGFGVAGAVGMLSVAVISRLTYRKRLERRETLRLVLDRRPRPTDPDSAD